MPPVFVRSLGSAASTSANSSISFNPGVSVTAGNDILVGFTSIAVALVTCTDNLGNRYESENFVNLAGLDCIIFRATSIIGGALSNITVAWTGSSNHKAILAEEWSGLGGYAVETPSGITDTSATQTLIPSQDFDAGELWWGIDHADATVLTAISPMGFPSQTVTLRETVAVGGHIFGAASATITDKSQVNGAMQLTANVVGSAYVSAGIVLSPPPREAYQFQWPWFAVPISRRHNIQLRTWLQHFNIADPERGVTPFNQDDWPNPIRRIRRYGNLTFIRSGEPFLANFDVPPIIPKDWPLPKVYLIPPSRINHNRGARFSPSPPYPFTRTRQIFSVRMNVAHTSRRFISTVMMNLNQPTNAGVLTAKNGQTFRYRMYSTDNGAEVTEAFERSQGSISVDNDREVVRTGTFTMYPQNTALAGTFALVPTTPFKVVREVLQPDGVTWQAFPRGVFMPTHIESIMNPNGYEFWQVQASDPGIQLTKTTTIPYKVPSGTNSLALAKQLIATRGLNVSAQWPADPATVLNFDKTFQPNTSWMTIVNWLLNGSNYYNAAFDNNGFAITRKKILWFNEIPVTTYSTLDPDTNMVLPTFNSVQDVNQFANQVGVSVDDQLRQDRGGAALAQNNDPASIIAVQALATQFDEGIFEKLDGNGTPDVALPTDNAFAIAMGQLRLAENASRAYGAVTLNTLVDPRRDVLASTLPNGTNEGFYNVTIDAFTSQVYRVAGWKEEFNPDQPMVHTLNKVSPVLQLTPPLLVVPNVATSTLGAVVQIAVAAINFWQPDQVTPNIVTSYAQTVVFSSTDPLAILPANYTFVPADLGQHIFDVQFETPGFQTVTVQAVSGGDTSRGTSSPVEVTA